MANYWAIAIGINQYQNFQPLSYAERDAQLLHHFLAVEAGFAPERCLLLTDNSWVRSQGHIAPTQNAIQNYIAQICQHGLQQDDVLWCFFSGYGVQFQGKDYLMPIDGDPTEVATTGIPIESLFSIFRAAPTDNIFLLLDMNRSQGSLGGMGVGSQTLNLAQEFGISTLLSCAPNQFSHETLGLRSGLFTAGLLEGLGTYGCLTLEHLVQFLGDRLIELSEHHCRPQQDPVAYIPDSKRYQLILPGKPTDSEPPELITPENRLLPPVETSHPVVSPDPQPPAPPIQPPPPPQPEPIDPPPTGDDSTWERLIKLSIVAGIALIGLTIFRNAGPVLRTPTPSPSPDPVTSPSPAVIPPVGVLPSSNPVSSPNASSQASPTPTSTAELTSPTLPAINFSAPSSPGNSSEVGPTPPPVNPQWLGGEGNGTAPTSNNGAPPIPNSAPVSQAPSDQAILNNARATLSRFRAETPNNQVSDIVEAIRQVRQIRPGQARYEEAQQVIERWSQIILDMAVGRAEQRNQGDSLIAARNYSSAIAAARMVPTDRPALYAVAQTYVKEWSQKISTIANARAGEGYLDLAVQVAQQVPSGTTNYAGAQQAIAGWQAQIQQIQQQQQQQQLQEQQLQQQQLQEFPTPESELAQ